MEVSEIKALTFDVFGTVVEWRDGIVREAEKLGRSKGIDADWGRFADEWRGRYRPALNKVRRGEMPWTKLDVLHRMNLDDVLEAFGVTGLGEAEIEDLNRAWERLDPWPDSVEGLKRLKSRFIIAAMSNGNVSLMVNLARYAGLPWDMVLGSELARHFKPDPKVYRTGADLLGLRPERCMMVAAHNYDLIAASKCGFRTAFVYRREERRPGDTKDLEPEGDYDFVAESLIELADQLGC